ncbi:MAG: PEP-CTERM sorting domain-containing protein [Deltaproteobacteria bacterium]|nr:PEP-CTERM sorting domain-containing protein [Deltaproteobacteria bacterium]
MLILVRWLRAGFFATLAAVVMSFGTVTTTWAGAGGADISSALTSACQQFNVSPCPTLPTTNQQVIEDAAISGASLADIRAQNNIPAGGAVDAGTYAGLSNPLAFISPPNTAGAPIPTVPTNPAANAFLSATTTQNSVTQTTLDLNFQYRSRTTPYGAGQIGTIVLPFVVADSSGDVLRQVSGSLNLFANSALDTVVGDFLGTGTPQSDPLSLLGVSVALSFQQGFADFDVQMPLVVGPGLNFFISEGQQFSPGLFDGIDPIASFLDANFLDNAGINQLVVNADLAVAFDGSTILSDPIPAPVPEPSTLVLLTSGLLAIGLLRRRRKHLS